MKKKQLIFLGILLFSSNAWAEDDLPGSAPQSLKDRVFVVETNENSASESLNRVAGHIDTGFSSFDQSFQSPDHYHPSPFALSDSHDKE